MAGGSVGIILLEALTSLRVLNPQATSYLPASRPGLPMLNNEFDL